MDRWLLVGALAAEVAPFVARLRQPRLLGPRLVVGRWLGLEVAVLRCGVGPRRAGQNTTAALRRWPASRVLSLGTCGALADDLAVGEVLTASRLSLEGAPAGPTLPAPGLRAVSLLTVRRVVADPAERTALAAAGHQIVEMEAAAVQAASSLPFTAVKVVSDHAGGHAGDDPPAKPGPVALLRFYARALALSHQALAPAVSAALRAQNAEPEPSFASRLARASSPPPASAGPRRLTHPQQEPET